MILGKKMKIPEGYRELLEDEIVKNDDLTFVSGEWIREDILSNKWRKYEPPPWCYFKIRKIEENKPKISKEKIHLILETLRQNRAFNADSAFYITNIADDYETVLELEKRGLIKSIIFDNDEDKYFYLNKKDKNQLLLLDVLEKKT